VLSGVPEFAEVARYRAAARTSGSFLPRRPSGVGRQEVHGWLAAEDSAHNGFVEIGVREIPNLHDERAVCNSS
jgi:hypothetical protein